VTVTLLLKQVYIGRAVQKAKIGSDSVFKTEPSKNLSSVQTVFQ